MLAYQKMAQDQGGLTAQQVQGYQQAKANSAAAQASLAGAQQAIAQAQYARSQTTGQDLANQKTQSYINSNAYQSYLNGQTDINGQPLQGGVSLSPAVQQYGNYGPGVSSLQGSNGQSMMVPNF